MPSTSIRKIVKIGNSSLAVILPRPWTRYYNLKYGDKVEVVSNGSIKINLLEGGLKNDE